MHLRAGEEQEKLSPPRNSPGQMSFSCFKYFLIVVSYRITKRLVENVKKKNKVGFSQPRECFSGGWEDLEPE